MKTDADTRKRAGIALEVTAWSGRDGYPMMTIASGKHKLYVPLDAAAVLAEMLTAEADRFEQRGRTAAT